MLGIEQVTFVGKVIKDPILTTTGEGVQACRVTISIDKGTHFKVHTLFSHRNNALNVKNKIGREDIVLFNCEPYADSYGFEIQSYQILKAKELK